MRKTLFSLALAALVLAPPAIVNGAGDPDRTACWDRIQEAKVSLNSTAYAEEPERKIAVDAIASAEVARSRQDYRSCVNLADFAIEKMEEAS